MQKKQSIEAQLRRDLQEASNLLRERIQWYNNMLEERNKALDNVQMLNACLSQEQQKSAAWERRFDLLLSKLGQVKP